MALNKHIIYWKNLVSRINSQKNILHIFYILHIEPIIITVAIKYLTKVRFNIVIYCISKHSSYLLLKKGRIKKKDKKNKNKKKQNFRNLPRESPYSSRSNKRTNSNSSIFRAARRWSVASIKRDRKRHRCGCNVVGLLVACERCKVCVLVSTPTAA